MFVLMSLLEQINDADDDDLLGKKGTIECENVDELRTGASPVSRGVQRHPRRRKMHHRSPREAIIRKLRGGGQNLVDIYVQNALTLTYVSILNSQIFPAEIEFGAF